MEKLAEDMGGAGNLIALRGVAGPRSRRPAMKASARSRTNTPTSPS